MDQSTQNHYRPRIEKLLAQLSVEEETIAMSAGSRATLASIEDAPLVVRRRQQLGFALDRIDGGYFGRCIRCGVNLPRAILETDPAALTCGTCHHTRRKSPSATRT